VDPGQGDSERDGAGRPAVPRPDFDTRRRLAQAIAHSRALIEQIEKGRSERERLRESAYSRLHARLDTMPVIEQAKGILMAQQRCGPDEAFDLLRRASQRANVKVSVLAAQIVERISRPEPDGEADRVSPGSRRRR
jgi:AmiR/NasT family two-component response regulator